MIGLGTNSGTLDAVQLGMNFPTTAMIGPKPLLATTDLDGLQLGGIDGTNASRRYASLSTAVGRRLRSAGRRRHRGGHPVEGSGRSSSPRWPDSTVAYPTVWNASPFSEPLQNAAKLVKANIGTDVIAIDAGSWDLHTNYGTISWGSMQSSISGLAQSLAAFFQDLGPLRNRVTVVTISEFGRRVAENGSQGFDHGWGNMMLVAGAGVKGGKYYGSWPGLDAASIADGDLKVTTDYRNVLGEIVSRRFPDRSVPSLFPGLSYNPLGFMA